MGIAVQVPVGAAPGAQLVVMHEGRQITITLPPGSVPGQTVQVQVPAAAMPTAQSGAMPTAQPVAVPAGQANTLPYAQQVPQAPYAQQVPQAPYAQPVPQAPYAQPVPQAQYAPMTHEQLKAQKKAEKKAKKHLKEAKKDKHHTGKKGAGAVMGGVAVGVLGALADGWSS